MNITSMLLSDAYKQVHDRQYSRGLTKLVSYWTPRKAMSKKYDRMVFFGLQAFIQDYLIDDFNKNFFDLFPGHPVTLEIETSLSPQEFEKQLCIKTLRDAYK